MIQNIHILGICGTFMGGIALLARELGFQVSGSDANVYPPMSTQLEANGIRVVEGYDPAQLDPAPDCVVIGNVMSRGSPAVEYVLDRGLAYTSGPAFLADHLLPGRWVLGVAGTHGKTTTASLLAWILEYAGLAPGFLVGGVPQNFGISARLGQAPFFVVEADEYDTAFFDKRSKFVHYHPRTLIISNLEYDHADIFDNLDAIKRQFHHLIRTVPSNGLVVAPRVDSNVDAVLEMGCWTPVERFAVAEAADSLWRGAKAVADGSEFDVWCGGEPMGRASWSLFGDHNMGNALAALAAARHAGVPVAQSIAALAQFRSVKRRMQLRGEVGGVRVFDDFAHHPTAIASTLAGLHARIRAGDGGRIIAVLELRSNTMRMGVHRGRLAASLSAADRVYFYEPEALHWDLSEVAAALGDRASVHGDIGAIIEKIVADAQPADHVVIMSNGAFGGIHDGLIAALDDRRTSGASARVSA